MMKIKVESFATTNEEITIHSSLSELKTLSEAEQVKIYNRRDNLRVHGVPKILEGDKTIEMAETTMAKHHEDLRALVKCLESLANILSTTETCLNNNDNSKMHTTEKFYSVLASSRDTRGVGTIFQLREKVSLNELVMMTSPDHYWLSLMAFSL